MASSSHNVIYAALIGNALTAAATLAAAALTGSAAMLSAGIHAVVDSGHQLALLHGMRQAAKAADPRFPLGHGREIYFWGFVAAILLFAAGAGVSLYEGVHHLMHPSPIERPLMNCIVLALALIFQGWAWRMALREFRRVKGEWGFFAAVRHGKDPSLFVVIFEISAAMLGLGVALVGILLGHLSGWPYVDGIASVLIGLMLAAMAVWLAIETKRLLIGESAAPEVARSIRQMARSRQEIRDVNEILTLHMGPDYILVNLSVEFDADATASDIEIAVAQLDARLKQAYPMVKRLFIEGETRHAAGAAG